MRLNKLYIEGFKNLDEFTLDFSNNDGLTVLIGNNGSGKSNILEAISMIFIDLKAENNNYGLNYTLEYEIENKQIKIDNYCESRIFTIDDEESQNLKKEYLPQQVIACYSGEVTRLWDIYREHYFNNNRKKIKTDNNPFLYIDLAELDIHKLASAYNEIYETLVEDDEEKIRTLNEKYENFELEISLSSYHKGLVKNEELMIFVSNITIDEKKINYISLTNYFNSLLPNTKQDFLNYLFNCKSRELIEEIKLDEQDILSEGEQKLKLIELIFDILAEKNTLILIDEIDSHIHVANKKKIKELIEKISDIENEVILVTLTHHFNDNHIIMINDGKVEDKTKQEIFSHITEGIWNYQEQSIFLSSQKDIILLVEGKHDKIHIEEAFKRLKNEYTELDFDIFSVDGADNINQLLIGIKSSYEMFDSNKKYIGLFDCDDKGRRIASGAKRKKYASLKQSKKFYYMFLPFDNYDKDFEIENMYPEYKLQEAYKKAIDIVTTNINKNTIEKEAKNQLSILCRTFNENNEDFNKFKDLFNLIKTIKDLP